ncbi:hypothetical protein AWC38_SpisGene25375, partial [Stylophora pistillata]
MGLKMLKYLPALLFASQAFASFEYTYEYDDSIMLTFPQKPTASEFLKEIREKHPSILKDEDLEGAPLYDSRLTPEENEGSTWIVFDWDEYGINDMLPDDGEFRVSEYQEAVEVVGTKQEAVKVTGISNPQEDLGYTVKRNPAISLKEKDNRVLNPKVGLMFSEDITRSAKSDIFLPLEYSSKDRQRGIWLLKEYPEHKLALTTALLGRDDTPLHRFFE